MKTYKPKNKFTQLHNKLIEKLASSRLTGSQHSIVQAIIRKTYGYQKSHDHISGSQLATLTGFSRTYVVRILSQLCKLKIITKYPASPANTLCINLNTSTWQCSDRISVPQDTTQDSDPQVTRSENTVQITASSSEDTHKNNIEIYEPVDQAFLNEIRSRHDFLQGGQHE